MILINKYHWIGFMCDWCLRLVQHAHGRADTDADTDAGAKLSAYLNRQMPPDKTGCGSLYVASQNGHVAIVEYLLSKGASVNLQRVSKDRSSSLYVACYQGHIKIVEKLLNHGADINQINNLHNTSLYIALHQAVHSVHDVHDEYDVIPVRPFPKHSISLFFRRI